MQLLDATIVAIRRYVRTGAAGEAVFGSGVFFGHVTVFTPEYIDTTRKRWSSTPENGQPLIARITLDPDRHDDRQRIESWVTRLHPDDQGRMAERIRNKDHFITAYGELMTAQVLMNAGLMLRYEPELSANGKRLTPDWQTVGSPSLVCDAFTPVAPRTATGTRRHFVRSRGA